MYASYGARYEGRIVQAMVKSAGGTGEFVEWAPPMLGLWNTVLSGEAHATWVFLGWEGVEAERKGVALNVFRLRDSGIPYGYSPVLAADPARLDPAVATAFLAATARGFDAAREQPEAAAAELCALAAAENPGLPAPLDAEMCAQSLRWLAAEGALAAPWGRMDRARWAAFLRWLDESGLLTSALPSRAPGGGDGAPERSLDDLRGGRAGEPVAAPDVDKLYTNAYLPA